MCVYLKVNYQLINIIYWTYLVTAWSTHNIKYHSIGAFHKITTTPHHFLQSNYVVSVKLETSHPVAKESDGARQFHVQGQTARHPLQLRRNQPDPGTNSRRIIISGLWHIFAFIQWQVSTIHRSAPWRVATKRTLVRSPCRGLWQKRLSKGNFASFRTSVPMDSKSWQDERTLVTFKGIDFLTRRHWLKTRSGVLIQKSDPFPEAALARLFSVQMPAAEVKLIDVIRIWGCRRRGHVIYILRSIHPPRRV